MLLLDALYPGTPSQVVSNCKAVGAAGCLGYVWRPGGIGGWTAAHFNALRAAGLVTAPIVVPAGDGSTSYATLIAAAKSFGFNGGPLVCDMESPYNLPSQSWWNGAISAFRAAGFKAIKYGNSSDVGSYANGDGWWKASYVQTTTQPVPALPPGLVGWQYADMDSIGGIQYDASVFAAGVFITITEEPQMKLVQSTQGLVYVTDGVHKRLVTAPQEVQDLSGLCGPVVTVAQYTLDRMVEVAPTPATPPTPIDLYHQRDQISQAANAPAGGGGGLTSSQDAALTDTHTKVTSIEAALKGA